MFADRRDAGTRLGERLRDRLGGADAVVVGLPRGGVVVAYEVARALGAPLDVIVVRKLGVPYQPELGFGAIGEGGVRVLNPDIVRLAGVTKEQMAKVEEAEREELTRRAARFRGGRPRVESAGRTVIVVDDGVATGGTARAACRVARAQGAKRVVLAVPVGSPDTMDALREDADEVVCLQTPRDLYAIGAWYHDFPQTSDEQVVELLHRAMRPTGFSGEVEADAAGVPLAGRLTVPEGARGIVVFVHGSGSSRHSPRNRYVAAALNREGLGTLLFDLLTPDEEIDRANVFDIRLLADRLLAVTRWLRGRPEAGGLPLGYFGASTGAAAALWAAAEPDADIAAVVSRGGRPDLAGERLPAVRAPTLLIVGGDDHVVLGLNQGAQQRLRCENRLRIVPGATHLFEEPGALEAVAELARDWFAEHFAEPVRRG
ncbi:phosphoribosyltransferase family protein [Microtetraspora malaysiensis]|uniref:phosphoribosyltransferase family protein n=1 Tax=Microtetraspora malaysiensis TaxID=161358 RepID=UPI000A051FBE|nr:phosphoribosyltransferase family protein [Microtetraspora malaysiensis]